MATTVRCAVCPGAIRLSLRLRRDGRRDGRCERDAAERGVRRRRREGREHRASAVVYRADEAVRARCRGGRIENRDAVFEPAGQPSDGGGRRSQGPGERPRDPVERPLLEAAAGGDGPVVGHGHRVRAGDVRIKVEDHEAVGARARGCREAWKQCRRLPGRRRSACAVASRFPRRCRTPNSRRAGASPPFLERFQPRGCSWAHYSAGCRTFPNRRPRPGHSRWTSTATAKCRRCWRHPAPNRSPS